MKYIFSLFVLVFIGCSSNPLDIPDEIWLNMSEDKKIQAYEQQASINFQREQNRKIELEIKAQEEKQQQIIYENKMANAPYGDRLQCIIYDAKAKLHKGMKDINHIGLDLLKNHLSEFRIEQNTNSSRKYSSIGYVQFDGIEVRICQDSFMRSNCQSVIGTFMDYSRGVNFKLNNDDFIIGKIKCELVPVSGSNIFRRH